MIGGGDYLSTPAGGDSVLVAVLARRAFGVVVFDGRSSTALVRMRLRKAAEEIVRLYATMEDKGLSDAQITDSDIDALFA